MVSICRSSRCRLGAEEARLGNEMLTRGDNVPKSRVVKG